jgi:hypothetical protein
VAVRNDAERRRDILEAITLIEEHTAAGRRRFYEDVVTARLPTLRQQVEAILREYE